MDKVLFTLLLVIFNLHNAFAVTLDDYTKDDFYCEKNQCSSQLSMYSDNDIKKPLKVTEDSDITKKEDLTKEIKRTSLSLQSSSKASNDEGWVKSTMSKFKLDSLSALSDMLKLENVSGIYVFGGYNKAMNTNMGRSIGELSLSSDVIKESNNDGYYAAIGGRYFTNHFMIGIEGYYTNPGAASVERWSFLRQQITNLPSGSQFSSNTTENMRSDVSIDRIYGANLRLGTGFKRFVVFGKLGFGIANIRDNTYGITAGGTDVPGALNNVTSYGVNFGGGIEVFVTDNIFLRAEYNQWRFDASVPMPATFLVNGVGNQNWNDSYDLRQVVVGIGIKF